MTANINLLPWREKARAQRQRAFVRKLLICSGMVIVLLGCWYAYTLDSIGQQKQRNGYLRVALKPVGQALREIDRLEKQQQDLTARMQVVDKLQSNRPLSVRLFDELPNVLPGDVQLTELKQSGSTITLFGRAGSNARVSTLMHNIQASLWLHQPELLVIEQKNRPAKPSAGSINDFSLSMQLHTPVSGQARE